MTLIDTVILINLLLSLATCVLMVTIFMDQRKRIAILEARLAQQPAPAMVDGNHRLLTQCTGFVDHAGEVRINGGHKLQPEFAGMPIQLYVVAVAE